MSGREWEAGDVAAIIANPFYAIEIHPSHSGRHLHPLTEDKWVASNERAMAELGRNRWLLGFLAALKKDHRDWDPSATFEVADPYPAITVHPTLCLEHEPLIDEANWVRANMVALEEGELVWMSNVLSVLKGAFAA